MEGFAGKRGNLQNKRGAKALCCPQMPSTVSGHWLSSLETLDLWWLADGLSVGQLDVTCPAWKKMEDGALLGSQSEHLPLLLLLLLDR